MDTIVALATPPGRSGIALIRLSGQDVSTIARKLINEPTFQFKTRYATLKKIFDSNTGEQIDDVIITYFKAPQSFTGEDIIEISCHGSPVLIRQIIDNCLQFDARLAGPGEFSLRALSNGKINLSQAEAIRDLIDAQTVKAARQSLRQLRGEFSNQLQPIKDDLLNVIVILESVLEFVEDDLPEIQFSQINHKLHEIADRLERMASSFTTGKLLREGIKIAIVGRPNVGKSSLFNVLIGQERAIVTDIAGTTRDTLHENLSIEGIPISLIDTAGIRPAQDEVEKIGVERSQRMIADADLTVVILDSSETLTFEDNQVLNAVKNVNHVIAINKVDLNKKNIYSHDFFNNYKPIEISAKTGYGIDTLQNAIVEPFITHSFEDQNFLVTDARHADLLNRAKTDIESSINLLEQKASEEIILIGLHNGLRYLGEITGETTTEDMLSRIFSTFCIGK